MLAARRRVNLRAPGCSATLAGMKVLVTGSKGFVGRRLMPGLAEAGHLVSGFDRDRVDICDPEAVTRAVAEAKADAVIHLAGISFIPAAAHSPDLARRVNVGGAKNLIRAIESETPRARLLLVGSGDQYEPAATSAAPLDENARLVPRGPYAESKAAAETLAMAATERGLEVIRIRAFNHTGPGQEPQFVAPDFAGQIARIEAGASPLMRVGNLDSVRDFLHVEDVVAAYISLLSPHVEPGIYNVASGVGTRIGEILELLAAQARVAPEILIDEKRWRPSDARVGDARKLQKATGWSPRVSLAATLSELLEYWRKRIRTEEG